MTAILDSCCCQNASQTMSTSPLMVLYPAILTMATMIITSERHKDRPRARFWRRPTRTSHKSTTGNDKTKKSVKISAAVVIAVSRITLIFPAGPEHAITSISVLLNIEIASSQSTFSTFVQGHVTKSATMAAAHDRIVTTSTPHHHEYILGKRMMSLRKKKRKASLTG